MTDSLQKIFLRVQKKSFFFLNNWIKNSCLNTKIMINFPTLHTNAQTKRIDVKCVENSLVASYRCKKFCDDGNFATSG